MEPEVISENELRRLSILEAQPELTVTRGTVATGERLTGLHVHREHVDAFYVLDGALTVEVGSDARRVVLGAGGFLAVPQGVAHGFLNDSRADTTYLNFHAPDAGFAAFIRGIRDGEAVAWDNHDVPSDGGLPADAVVVVEPGEGEALVEGNRTVVVKSELADLLVVEFIVDGARGGPPAHSHDVEVDAFYLLEGQLDATIGGEARSYGPGELASAPVGVVHTFSYPEHGVKRFLNIHAPECGFADFLRHGPRA
jgi:quercetin dioxygenase-like cupin family protein